MSRTVLEMQCLSATKVASAVVFERTDLPPDMCSAGDSLRELRGFKYHPTLSQACITLCSCPCQPPDLLSDLALFETTSIFFGTENTWIQYFAIFAPSSFHPCTTCSPRAMMLCNIKCLLQRTGPRSGGCLSVVKCLNGCGFILPSWDVAFEEVLKLYYLG